MNLNVAVQMDPIARINIRGDSTFALLLEAQKRGHSLSYYTPDQLSLRGEELIAPVQKLTVRDEVGDHFTLGEAKREPLTNFDVILLRQDPPFDLAYITSTHFLERIHPKTLVVNNPASVRNAPEKLFVMDFPHLMPPTLISRDLDEINSFRDQHGAVVMKPLHGHGGAAVFRVMPQDMNFGSLFDMFSVTFREPWVIQRFLPEVKHGDKRIILVDGEFAGAVNRVPAPDDLRSNMVRGGRRAGHGTLSARARNLRHAGSGAARARAAVRRHRRDRRQPHRDQRDVTDGHSRDCPARRAGRRWNDLGHHREEARRKIIPSRPVGHLIRSARPHAT
ncbi:glutathione synthase [Bradyrhizobium sp. URHC0002]